VTFSLGGRDKTERETLLPQGIDGRLGTVL
jgi:hypothetical protein